MSKRLAVVGVCAVVLWCCAQRASASATVTTPQEADKEFKLTTKDQLAQMKTDLKDVLTTFKEHMADIKVNLADGSTSPFVAAADIADEVRSAFQQASLSYVNRCANVDTDGSSFITQVAGNPIFPGARHGEGGTLDKFVRSVKKELDKFTSNIDRELAKIRKAVLKNDGSLTNLKFIASVQPFPRPFDPTPALGSGTLNGGFLNTFLAGIALIDFTGIRQDVFVIGMCRTDADVQFRQGDDSGTTQGAKITGIARTNGIFSTGLTNQAITVPLYADGFETGTTVAFSNTVP